MITHLRPWLFDLARFDEPDQPPADDPGNPDDQPDTDPEPGNQPDDSADLGEKGRRALDRMKAERNQFRREASEAKRRADALAAQVAEYEDRDKTEAEKLAQRAERAEQRAQTATQRAVRAEVRALAADAFADPEDAHAFLDLTSYTGDDGQIDVDAIQVDLEQLLERKPHLRKQVAAPPPKKQPKPDPSQGPRQDPGPVDYRKADRETFKAAAAQYGIRTRS
ncbi:hypothetical protein [Microbispora sp. CA-102843]|uniref:hypothetical protein n=1 Tax=Microbispora sp. CA-102843 TaxID=3239952 RepID=UPI003D934BAF